MYTVLGNNILLSFYDSLFSLSAFVNHDYVFLSSFCNNNNNNNNNNQLYLTRVTQDSTSTEKLVALMFCLFWQQFVFQITSILIFLHFSILHLISCVLYPISYDPVLVVQRLDSTIHQINLCLVDSAVSFPNTYAVDKKCDLSCG